MSKISDYYNSLSYDQKKALAVTFCAAAVTFCAAAGAVIVGGGAELINTMAETNVTPMDPNAQHAGVFNSGVAFINKAGPALLGALGFGVCKSLSMD